MVTRMFIFGPFSSRRLQRFLSVYAYALYFVLLLIPICFSQIIPDGSLGPSGPLNGPDYTIGEDLGRTRGNNLFHSFSEFNIRTGETATFTGPDSIRNILSRVTGANDSLIDGELGSAIQGVNLYFINPNGVQFGPNATLNVSGSFHVGTADYLTLEDGVEFHTDLSRGSQLSAANIQAFGFLNGNPKPISVRNSMLEVQQGQMLSLIGGDIELTGGTLKAQSGQVTLASVASSGEVTRSVFNQRPNPEALTATELGTIDIGESSHINADGASGGTVIIRGGRFMVDDNGMVSAKNRHGQGGKIDIEVEAMHLGNRSQITAGTLGNGNAGKVTVIAGEDITLSESSIFSRTDGAGNAGTISLSAPMIVLAKSSIRASSSANSSGSSGRIMIENVIDLALTENSTIIASSQNSGDAGQIRVTTSDSILISNSEILNLSLRDAGGGKIELVTKDLLLTDGALITSSSVGREEGGDIEIKATEAITLSASEIRNISRKNGDAGKTSLDTSILNLSNNSAINSSTPRGTGAGGNIEIRADETVHISNSLIGSRSLRQGNAGEITILTKELNVTAGGQIRSSTQGNGDGGVVRIDVTDRISISGTKIESDRSSGIFTDSGLNNDDLGMGNGGDIAIRGDDLYLSDGGKISASSITRGEAGNVQIELKNNLFSDKGTITTSSVLADGGNIEITTNNLTHLINSSITSEVSSGQQMVGEQQTVIGNGGNISITQELAVLEGSKIDSTADGGNGGNINITAKVLVEDAESSIDARSGKGGIDGLVDIQASIVSAAGDLVALPQEFLSAPDLLNAPCEAGLSDGKASSFIVRGQRSLPVMPGSFLPTSFIFGKGLLTGEVMDSHLDRFQN